MTEEKPHLDTQLSTLGSVGRIKWRPGKRAHIASTTLALDGTVNVWDIRRPFVPLAVFSEHEDVATGLVWRGGPDALIAAGKDNSLYLHAFKDGYKPQSCGGNSVALDIHNGLGTISYALRNENSNDHVHKSAIDDHQPTYYYQRQHRSSFSSPAPSLVTTGGSSNSVASLGTSPHTSYRLPGSASSRMSPIDRFK